MLDRKSKYIVTSKGITLVGVISVAPASYSPP